MPRLVAFLLLLSDDSSGELSDGPEHAQCREPPALALLSVLSQLVPV